MLPFKAGLSADKNTVTLKRLPPIEEAITYHDADDQETLNLIFLDTETTGLTADDEMVEIGIAAFKVRSDGRFVKYFKTRNWLNEPGRPMHPEAEQVTGLSLDDLKGERFDDAEIEKVLQWADVIVAHNARFDYQKMQMRYSNALRGKVWLCSVQHVDWLMHGHDSAKLSTLAYEHGFFFEKHRTDGDIHAMACLLSFEYKTGKTYLSELLDHRKDQYQALLVLKSPFASKDAWRPRGYFWHPVKKSWWCLKQQGAIADEQRFIDEELSRQFPGQIDYRVADVPMSRCFDERLIDELLG